MRIPHKEFFVFSFFVAVLALGGFHPWIILIVLGSLLVSFFLDWYQQYKSGLDLYDADPVVIYILFLLLITSISLIPLPGFILSIISSNAFEIWRYSNSPLSNSDLLNYGSISLDPAGTKLEILKLMCLFICYLLTVEWVKKYGANSILTIFGFLGFATFIVAFGHSLLGLQKVYDLYLPRVVNLGGFELRGPFLNSNHLGGFFLMISPIALGIGLEREEKAKKIIWIIISGLLGLGVFLTLSRGAIATYIIISSFYFILYTRLRIYRKKIHLGTSSVIYIIIAAIFAVSSAAYLAWDSIVSQYIQGDLSKSKLWIASLSLIKDYWFTGIGRGAFASVFSPYWNYGNDITFTHPESFIFQYLSEWGIITGGFTVIGLVYLAVKLPVSKALKPKELGAALGVTGIIIQNLTDFGLELLGISLLCVSLIAVVRVKIRRRKKITIKKIPLKIGLVVGLIILVLFPFLSVQAINGYQPDLDEKIQHLISNRMPKEKALPLLRFALKSHPADYYIPYQGGMWSYYSHEDNPLRWFSRSITLNKNWGQAHFMVAKILWNKGHKNQSILEFGQALIGNKSLINPAYEYMVKNGGIYSDLISVAKTRKQKIEWLPHLINNLQGCQKFDEAYRVSENLLKIEPNNPLFILINSETLCNMNKLDQALTSLKKVGSINKLSNDLKIRAIFLEINIWDKKRDKNQAKEIISKGLKSIGNNPELLRRLFYLNEENGQWHDARLTLAKLFEVAPLGWQEDLKLMEANLEERSGNPDKAILLYHQIYRQNGSSGALEAMARIAEQRGEYLRALTYYGDLQEISVDSSNIAAKIDSLKKIISNKRLEQLMIKKNGE